ncbi:hypothetical protein QQS21_012018, partial [Conoideocrella luteorostrata]
MSISASTQNRILIWRSEVASALDDAASSAGSSMGAISLSDTQSSAENSYSRHQSNGAIARGRRVWHRITRRLSGGRFGGISEEEFDCEPAAKTAMYRAPPPPPPPVDERGLIPAHEEMVDLGEESSDGKAAARGGLKEKQERLERAARLLGQQPHATTAPA